MFTITTCYYHMYCKVFVFLLIIIIIIIIIYSYSKNLKNNGTIKIYIYDEVVD